jgi:hypothetical protein
MPDNRSATVTYFVPRTKTFFEEARNLQPMVIMDTKNLKNKFTLDVVAELVAFMRLIKIHEISIGILTNGRYLISLPQMLAPENFVKAIPQHIWNMGVSFYTWSPLDKAEATISWFKV